MASIAAPPGYTVEDEVGTWGQDDSTKGLYTVFALGLVLVLIAVAFVFDSVWAPVMVFLAIPLALAGVIAAFWMTGTAFTREAAVGVILVVGLAVNHTILQIDAAVVSRRRHGRLTGADVFHAASDRVTMIVLVTLTTLASLIPMAVGTDTKSLFGAIALATAGGTVGGTLGVMFLLPPMMLGFRRFRSSRARHRAAGMPGHATPASS
jgi:HAE1 family hydrophobic/amphiphilic exporter-1